MLAFNVQKNWGFEKKYWCETEEGGSHTLSIDWFSIGHEIKSWRGDDHYDNDDYNLIHI